MAQDKFPVRHPLSRLQNQIDHLFENFWEPLTGGSRDLFSGGEMGFSPACDVEETDRDYVLCFDLPGLKKDAIKIEMHENQLIVSGERKEERKTEEKGRTSRERSYGSFYRMFTLPSNIDAEKIQANYEDGVLQITVPKSATKKPKQIQIQEGKRIEAKKEKAA